MRERFAQMAHWMPAKAVIDKIHMTPLTEKQTAEYLQHRLRAAGYLRGNPFSPAHVREIYERSGGLPGWINGEAYLLLKRLSRHRKGFKKSILMDFVRCAMDFRNRVVEWSRIIRHLRYQTTASMRRN